MEENKLYYGDEYIAYSKYKSKSNKNICVVFFHGWMSNRHGNKAQYIENYCKKKDIEYVGFDYYAHGNSSGENKLATIGIWLDNCVNVINSLTDKNVIIIGSSLGGWLMLLASLKLGDKIKGLIGIAPSVDFTVDLIIPNLNDSEQNQLNKDGYTIIESDHCSEGYLITKEFLEESKNHILMNKMIKLNLPIILIHGMCDRDVPYMTSVKLAENIVSDDIRIELVKDGGHNLARDTDLKIIKKNLKNLIKNIQES